MNISDTSDAYRGIDAGLYEIISFCVGANFGTKTWGRERGLAGLYGHATCTFYREQRGEYSGAILGVVKYRVVGHRGLFSFSYVFIVNFFNIN